MKLGRDSLSDVLVSAIRILFGFVAAFLMAFLGDVVARVVSLSLGYPWSLAIHQNIQIVGTGFGAGAGAYVAWANLGRRWYVVSGAIMIVLAGGVGGAYVGTLLGPGVDPTYWWSRFASDPTVHLGSAALSICVATILGLIDHKHTRSRLRSFARPIE